MGSISMNFVGGLLMTRRGHDSLYVVVDRFNEMSALMPCTKTIKGREVTILFFEKVWVNFGIPRSVVLDRDTGFLSIFWISLWENLDTKLKRFTTFHPYIDGKTKMVNRTLVQLSGG
jgi:hypothetical protein